jgi:2-amino-4-hydroxy-6-hydroxymethyldihydropteridine diphosphokinase
MRVFIGLGSNLDKPQEQIETAINDIKLISAVEFVASSSLYRSPPMGPQDQPDYINAVIAVETKLTPHDLLDKLQAIEQQHGRVRQRHWGERTLDLDLLVYGDTIINDERLVVPHPGIAERAFVIYPLAEIDKEFIIPLLGTAEQIAIKCPLDGLEKMENITL